jgi:hypothetical protein
MDIVGTIYSREREGINETRDEESKIITNH